MPGLDILIAFALATAVFAYMPGPAMLYTTAQTLAHGRRAGWLAALGIHIGGYVHVLAATFGLALLFQAVPLVYIALKFAGAAYLVYLGVVMILTRPPAPDAPAPTAPAFWQAIAVEVLNPKTALFFLAFLPQFTDASAPLPIWAQLLVLGTLVNVMFSSADAICVLLADRLAATLRRSVRMTGGLQRICGGILIALGTSLAIRA